ncbi:MAG TPA: threonine ammonia-lyase [Rhizomicrobium sp.]|jgi:threonine dehydratase
MDGSPGVLPTFPEVTLDDIRAAAKAIEGVVGPTPSHWSRTLSAITGADIHLKFENLHFTSSFKERGALNKLLSLTPEEKKRGVAAMSAGNHAQGVAYHAQRLGIPATIVMPEGTPYNKIKHTKNFGARVILYGVTLEQAFERAHQVATAEQLAFIHPYEDAKIVAGQGTVALELLEAAPDLDAIVAPIGGGGLISGIALGAKALKPGIEIYGAEAEVCPSMYDVLKNASLPCSVQTIAEGIAVKKAGDLACRVLAAFAKDVLLVREDQIEAAIVTLLEVEKTVAEGAGATALAAVMANPELFRGRKVGVIISGGNIDMRLLSNVILRELSREGRILSLIVKIEDRPGLLARIATVVSETGGNILEVSHNRMLTDMSAKSADLGLTIEARDAAHAKEIRTKLEDAGFVLRPNANG